jgi:hypothetical protein
VEWLGDKMKMVMRRDEDDADEMEPKPVGCTTYLTLLLLRSHERNDNVNTDPRAGVGTTLC